MNELGIFVVLGVTSPPHQLEWNKNKQTFSSKISHPLPPQLLIFCQGPWPQAGTTQCTMDVVLSSEKIGTITSHSRCFAWDTATKQVDQSDGLALEVKVIGLKEKLEPKKDVRKGAKKSRRIASPQSVQEVLSRKITEEKTSCIRSKKPKDKVAVHFLETSEKEKAAKAEETMSSRMTFAADRKSTPVSERKTKQTQLHFAEKHTSCSSPSLEKVSEQKVELKLGKSESMEEHKEMEVEHMSKAVIRLSDDTSTEQTKCWDMQMLNETTPQLSDMPSPIPRKPAKKWNDREKGSQSADGPTPRKRGTNTRMRALTSEASTPKAVRTSKLVLNDSTPGESINTGGDLGHISEPERKMACCTELPGRAPCPTSRWGHTMLLTNPRCAVLIGGQGERQQLSKDSVWTLHTDTRRWHSQEIHSEGQKPENRTGHTATYDPTMRCIYIFGGSKNCKWFHDVHMYDLDENKWMLVKVNSKAPTRAYHTATLYRHELWIFGGVYPRPDPNPDGCSNEIQIFSPVMQNWYSPLVTGDKPLPRSGHSATLIGDQMVMFGGWDAPFCYNDLFILDMTTVDWCKPNVKGIPPVPRSWHASCGLSGKRILIHGGYDGNNALEDTHIFDLGNLSWSQILLSNRPNPRAGHKAVSLPYNHENQEEDEVLIFGGGDNDGTFFQDLLSFSIPFHPVLEAM